MKIIFDMLFSNGINYSKKIIPRYLFSVICSWANISESEMAKEWENYKHLELEINDEVGLSFRDVIKLISKGLHFDEAQVLMCQSLLYVLVDDELSRIEDYDILLKDFLKLYSNTKELQVFFVFSAVQGSLFLEKGMLFYMHSNEQGHNKPHVHVNYKHEYDASFSIPEGIMLRGSFPLKLQKEVKTIIEENKERLLDCWIKKTNGISVNINFSVLKEGIIES